jgi:hypothetical protein
MYDGKSDAVFLKHFEFYFLYKLKQNYGCGTQKLLSIRFASGQ